MENMKELKNGIMQFSDYSFLERSVHEIYIWMWFIVHVWRCDRFSSLNWNRIVSLELKSFVTLFILFSLPLGSFYDIVLTKIKYVEGLYKFDNAIRAKPKWLWSEDDQLWFIPSYYILMVSLGFQTVTLFLLQCFWNYLTNSIAKTSFMSRAEFAVYIVWGIISIAIYPVLPYIFNNNDLMLQAVPQLVFATQMLILVILGIRTHLKFIGLIKITSSYKNSANIIAKIRYFIDMNKLLTSSLAVTSISFYVLSIDLFTPTKLINNSKVASDLLVAHVNFASVIEWLTLILIFYPRKGFVGTGAGGSTFNTNIGSSSINPSANPTYPPSQSSYSNSLKLSNVPPGSGAGINLNNERRQKPPSIIDVNQANNNKSVPLSPDFKNVTNDEIEISQEPTNGIEISQKSKSTNGIEISQKSSNGIEISQKPTNGTESSQKQTIHKQSSFKRFKKKSPSSDNNSDQSNSDNNDGNNKPVYLKRNISISKDGKMVYGETKPLGKVKGTEFVAVEKADPSFIPSYYFSNDLKDRDGNVVKIPSMLNDRKFRYDIDDDDNEGSNSGVSGGSDQQAIKQGMVKQETIVPQQGTIRENNDIIIANDDKDKQDSDEEEEFFYAM
ncbi:hypothetical protein RclHR1_01500014 [Rhizophagus clarus]|uniref:Transmembrane protein n=1 Tax=Rhizophagus clarus TaxID=94130 RepID=A0A2Z6QTE7_9GLOM|nr:hypothetical protein RclHR1_01500014 [Rhizophagus clarus]GES72848.1 hypothetical protein GLOIN_2v1855700 [Rhizophagus clarus]